MNKLTFENLNTFLPENVVGAYDIPCITGCNCTVASFVGFNYAKSSKQGKPGEAVHFFLDDMHFSAMWTRPDKYIDRLRTFDAVLTPDFSLYTDMPVALQIYNHYRKHWMGAYWEYLGLNVIPTIAWSDKNSYNWCFDGEPTGKTVAISAIGTQRNPAARELFLDGFNEMLKRLNPSEVLCYGKAPDEIKGSVKEYPSFSTLKGWS